MLLLMRNACFPVNFPPVANSAVMVKLNSRFSARANNLVDNLKVMFKKPYSGMASGLNGIVPVFLNLDFSGVYALLMFL